MMSSVSCLCVYALCCEAEQAAEGKMKRMTRAPGARVLTESYLVLSCSTEVRLGRQPCGAARREREAGGR